MPERLKAAVIGCGRVAVKHLKAISKNSDRCVLAALVDVSEEAPRKLLASAGVKDDVRIFSDYKQMIDDIHPDIVAVTVPSGLHYQIAEYALNNGCNLLLEKPMTMSSSESRKIHELSMEKGKVVAMGHIYRYFPLVKLIRDDIASGVYGKVLHGTITVRWGHGMDYYDQAAWRGTWKSDGGAMMNQTIHAIDLLVWLMGSKPVEAVSMIAKRLRDIEAEDLGMAVLRMDDGALALIEGTTATSPDDQEASFTVLCEKATIKLGLVRGKIMLDIRDSNLKKLNMRYIRRQIKAGGLGSFLTALNPHTGIYSDLISSIEEGRQPVADSYSGYSSVDTLMGIYRSARDGKAVSLPLTEDFSSTDMEGYAF